MNPHVALSDGAVIPTIGFGVWQVKPEQTEAAVSHALEAGYRHIDTAQMYGNEAGVGAALAASDLARGDVFVTSKLNNNNHASADARDSVARTLEALQSDYVDLFLIHWPLATLPVGFLDAWKVLIEEQAAGRIRSIGVSNFHPEHLDVLVKETGVAPVVNQVEVHPYFANARGRSGEAQGIVTQAWSPLASGALLTDEKLAAIAAEADASVAQVVLAWHLQAGRIILPKSVTPSRIVENFAASEVVLTADQVAAIDALDRGVAGRTGPDPDEFTWVPQR